MFREVDDDHKNYFDAVWYSLQNKFLNGISVNFGEFKYAYDDKGDMMIDDAEVIGFSYLDSPAGTEHSITEVMIRSLEEGKNKDEEKKMEDEKKQLELERKNLENEKIKYLKDKEELDKEKLRLQTMADEEAKKAELEKQAELQKKIEKDLADKTEEAKKLKEENTKLGVELNRAKGVVGQQQNPNVRKEDIANPKFYEENIKKITERHDAYLDRKSVV